MHRPNDSEESIFPICRRLAGEPLDALTLAACALTILGAVFIMKPAPSTDRATAAHGDAGTRPRGFGALLRDYVYPTE